MQLRSSKTSVFSLCAAFLLTIASLCCPVLPAAASTTPTRAASPPIAHSSHPSAPDCSQAAIQRLVESVSPATIEGNLKELVQDDSKPKPNELISRHITAPGNQVKTNWILQTMTGYGLQAQLEPFSDNGIDLNNVVVTIAGKDPTTIYGAGAHIDSQSKQPAEVAPGADDDGSGVVAWMEAARVLQGFQDCLKASIQLVGFNDEEEGMRGSRTYVEGLDETTMKGFYNMDMVGYTPTGECLKSDANLSIDEPIAQKLVDMNSKYHIGLPVTTGHYSVPDGDNRRFWSADLPSAYLVECATENRSRNYPGYHSANDTIPNVNVAQVAKVAKLLVAMLAESASQENGQQDSSTAGFSHVDAYHPFVE